MCPGCTSSSQTLSWLPKTCGSAKQVSDSFQPQKLQIEDVPYACETTWASNKIYAPLRHVYAYEIALSSNVSASREVQAILSPGVPKNCTQCLGVMTHFGNNLDAAGMT